MTDAEQPQTPLTEQDVLDVLKNVYDPELQMDLVSLGLIYGVEIGEAGRVHVKMTLTTPGCPYGPQLINDARAMLMMLRGVKEANVELVWDPPWSPQKMSEEARLELGFDV